LTSFQKCAILIIEREVIAMVEVWAINKVTEEELFLGYCDTEEDAQEDIDNNIEWDDLDNPDDWRFEIRPAEDYEEPCDIDDDCGFDPYCGCYTYDC
jgi:hypothetical protein